MIYEKENIDSIDIREKGNIKKEYVILENEKAKIRLPEELICIEYFDYNDSYSYFDMDPRVRAGGYVWQRKAVVVKGETVLAEDIEMDRCPSFSVDGSRVVIQKSDNGADMLAVNILNESEQIVIGEITYDSESEKYICEGFTF